MLSVLLNNRYLIWELVWRDIRSRYIGSLIGVFWSVLNPVFQLLLYTAIFSVVLKIRFGEEASTGRFALILFCALLPWMAIQESATRSATCFLDHGNLIKKVRFPLPIIPFSIVVSAFIHQLIGTLIFAAVLIVNQNLPSALLPAILTLYIFQLLLMYGLALSLACATVFFRDVVQVLGVLFMLAFWLTPIVYPKNLAPQAFQWLLNLNPLTHMVEAYRFLFLGTAPPSPAGLLYWIGFCMAICFAGHFILNRTRRELVDLI